MQLKGWGGSVRCVWLSSYNRADLQPGIAIRSLRWIFAYQSLNSASRPSTELVITTRMCFAIGSRHPVWMGSVNPNSANKRREGMGKYLMVVGSNALPGREGDYAEWYAKVHLDEICVLDGVTSGRPYEATSASPTDP